MSAVQKANNEFTTGLYQALFTDTSTGNLIFSPFSLHAVLGMVGVGARASTRSEILTGLKFTEDDDQAIGKAYNSVITGFQSASGFNLSEVFVNLLKEHFQADLEQLNFSAAEKAAQKINEWVETTTNSKIKDLISKESLNRYTRTTKEEFRVTKSLFVTKKIKVDMMHNQCHLRYAALPELDAAAAELPYKGDRLSMIIILPRAVGGLPKIQSSIGSITPGGKSIFRERSGYANVKLSLPKFKIEATIENLKEVLQSLGIKQMFSEENANFSGMTDKPNPDLYVSAVVQNAFIEVNEEGAEAAAATGVVVEVPKCRKSKPKPVIIPFIVDHPFYFQIVSYENGLDMVLFSGHCNDPTK